MLKIVILAAVLGGCRPDHPQRSVTSLIALGDDRAAMIESNDKQNAVVGVRRASGELAWQTALAARAVVQSLASSADTLLVRYWLPETASASTYVVEAFAASDGARLWRRTLATSRQVRVPEGPATWPAEAVIELHPRSSTDEFEMTSLQMSDGTTLWSKPTYQATRFEVPQDTTGFVTLTTAGAPNLRIIDLKQGTGQALNTLGTGCFASGAYYSLRDFENSAIVVFTDAKSVRTVAPFRPYTDRLVSRLVSCGSYVDRLVFLVDAIPLPVGSSNTTHVVMTDKNGKITSRLDLGSVIHPGISDHDVRDLRTVPFHGEMTRFVPYIATSRGGTGAITRLLIIDLETATIARTSTNNESLIHYRLFRHGALWILSRAEDIVIIDGSTGVLRVAVRVMPPGSIADLDPSHIADKNLWLFQRGRPGLSDSPLVLNVETLEPRRKTRMQIIDVTAEYRTRLGIP